uniref:HNH endonuclease n=1 Tax=Flavobacterium sp. TaxID=239 RepID=UPI00404B6DE8
MVSLNKDNQNAIDYVTNFIKGQWFEDSKKYIGIGFNDGAFNKATLKNYCLEEQQNVCCYCSRKIDNSNNTELEHIIPRSIDTEIGLMPYFDLSHILADNIVLQESFRASTVKQITPPFPHHIAYHNIVASCNGKIKDTSEDLTCCNRNRGNDFVPPFNFMPNSIAYLNDGTIYYVNDEIDNRYINPLNLNKALLKNIRRIWLLFANSDLTLDELLQASTINQIKEIFTLHIDVSPNKTIADSTIIDSFKNEAQWKTLMNYKYFLDYFRINNN